MRHNKIGAVVCLFIIPLLGSCSSPAHKIEETAQEIESKEISNKPVTAMRSVLVKIAMGTVASTQAILFQFDF